MSEEKFTLSSQKVSDRNYVTQQLFQNIGMTTTEEQILKVVVQEKDSWASATLTFYSSKILESALSKHATALIKAGEASDRHARSLTIATWVLAVATIILALATLALLY